VIRLEQAADREAAADVERRAFGHGRGGEPAEDIVRIVERLREDPEGYALVAQEGGAIVGHVQFSRGWIGPTPALTLGPIGVLPERQGAGIASRLIGAGFAEARRRGEVAVMLLGDPRFYGRFGFRAGSALGLRNPATGVTAEGFEILEEHFQVVTLAAATPPLGGEVRWHPALG